MRTKINYSEFIKAFQESMGIEAAEQILTKAIIDCRLEKKPFYEKDEALLICETLKKNGGFISIVSSILASRILLR